MTNKIVEQNNCQQSLVQRLLEACGGSYPPETRRKYYITGPQWAASYQGQALFHAPTREPVSPAEVMHHFAEIGIGYWTTHDTDIIRTEDLMTDRQAEILADLKKSLVGEWTTLLDGDL
jgi:xylose isomerase